MKYIIINDIKIELEKKRIKNMYLKILPPEGRVHITAPIRMSEDEIRRFVLTKLEWIMIQQAKIQQRNTHQDMLFISGDEIYVWGKKYQLSILELQGRPKISIEEGRLLLCIKKDSTTEQRKRVLDTYYKELLNSAIPNLIIKWEQSIGVKSQGYSIRDMKTRWGTCNIRTKKICLSLQLAKKSPQCLEYVVVHELVHLLEGSHNSVFKAYMDRFIPDWRRIKKEMNGAVIS